MLSQYIQKVKNIRFFLMKRKDDQNHSHKLTKIVIKIKLVSKKISTLSHIFELFADSNETYF